MRIVIFTKIRHLEKLDIFLRCFDLEYQCYTVKDEHLAYENEKSFDYGISYCYGRLIKQDMLNKATQGFINFHPAPLPEYPGGDPYSKAITDKVMYWGSSAHWMDSKYDNGPLIRVGRYPLHEPPRTRDELGAIAHYFNFKLFKQLMSQILNDQIRLMYAKQIEGQIEGQISQY